MTKFKEYLMARGAILECNSAELAQDENWDVEFIIPKVLDSGLAISYCHVDDHVPDVVVYDRSGACRYVSRSEYQAYVGNRHHDPGRGYNATEERKELVKDQYLKKLYALING